MLALVDGTVETDDNQAAAPREADCCIDRRSAS
jgi:hypothetical protein